MKKFALAACLLGLSIWPLSGMAYHSGESVIVMPAISSVTSNSPVHSAIHEKISQMHAKALTHLEEFEKLKNKKPPRYQDYYYNYVPVDVFVSGKYVSLIMEEDLYTGGAHSIRHQESVVFRVSDGKIMTAPEYLGISEKAFRKLMLCKVLQHTDESLRWPIEKIEKLIAEKKDWQFALDRDKGPVIIFNKYELAPGAAGFIRIPLQNKPQV